MREKCPYLEFFWSLFPRTFISPYSLRKRETAYQKNSEYWNFYTVIVETRAFNKKEWILLKLYNVSMIKFYDFYLFHYIHWNKTCNAFQWIWHNYASLKRNVICFKPQFFAFSLIEILLNFVEVFIFHWLLCYIKKNCKKCLFSLF